MAATAPAPLGAQAGNEALRNAARRAESRYECIARWLAPVTYAGTGGECTEVVGRFCLTFDTLARPRSPSTPRREVLAARAEAIEAQRRYFESEPGELRAAAPLVRLLVEEGRAADAVEVARRFAVRTDSLIWRDWLLGYALHAAGEDSLAGRHFELALERTPPNRRAQITSIEWLIEPAERRRLRELDAVSRDALIRRFWSLGDPRLATSVNELRVQHVARWVESRIRERVPIVSGMLRWGADLDQLTVRYGTPVAREKIASTRITDTRDSFVEYFDTTALAFAPRLLRLDSHTPPRPGERWPLGDPAPRSAHAFPSLAAVRPLEHQLTRLPRGDSMLVRIDTAPPHDSLAAAVEAALFLLNRSGATLAQARTSPVAPDGTVTLELLVPRDTLIYGLELYRGRDRTLFRARYTLEPLARARLEVSDILLTAPLSEAADSLELDTPRARTDLRLEPEETVGIEAELHGVTPGEAYEVDIGFAAAERPSAAARAFGWLGRQLGLVAESKPARVRWEDRAGQTRRVRVNVVAPRASGYYFVELRVRARGREAHASRLVRVLSADAAGAR